MHRAREILEKTESGLDLLNRALGLEYSLIVHYPRLANSVQDKEIRALINSLGSASVEHANTVIDAIRELGGRPDWTFEPFPEQKDLLAVMKMQLEREKTALELHRRNAEAVKSPDLRNRLAAMVDEEKSHIETIKSIISRLTESQA
jgi:rubrerythrin